MLFNSISFLIFFPIVTILYFALPHKYRWALLLLASCIFYMFFIPIYIWILIVTITIDYLAAIYIEKTQGTKRKSLLVLSIISTCLLLFIFKYFNFFNTSFAAIADFFNLKYPIDIVNIILPIGLSFHTFQSLSYVIEVYRGNQKAEKNFGIYSLYVMFYPQLVAGPIERPQNLLPQFYEEHNFEYQRVVDGLTLMAWGMYKKVVIADRLSVVVNKVYDSPTDHIGLTLVIATIFFGFQVYSDFSGYSDIAIGSAKVMGFRLIENFNQPYSSRSIQEFWNRWHISLSHWLRDYLFLPLSYSFARRLNKETYLFIKADQLVYIYATIITFSICGLWHGAKWTFVVWGILHGLYLVFGMLFKKMQSNTFKKISLKKDSLLRNSIEVISVFMLVSFAWIFFRAKSFNVANYIITHLFSNISFDPLILFPGFSSKFEIVLSFFSIFFMTGIQYIQKNKGNYYFFSDRPFYIRWSFYLILMISMILFGAYHNNVDFIYFQF